MPATQITGLLFGSDYMEAATLTEATGRGAVEPVCLEGEREDMLSELRGRLEGDLHVGIPGEVALVGVVDLPTREEEEIRGMVSLRAEEESPFPAERTCVGWEKWAETPGGCRVVYALCSLSAVQQAHDALASVRRRIERVDVDVLGWLRQVVDAGAMPSEGSHLLLWLHRARTHLVLVKDGAPILFRSPGDSREWSGEELAEEIRPALAVARADWGVERVEGLRVWHDGEAPRWLSEMPEGVVAEVRPIADLGGASVGIARRGWSGAGLDLSPAQWKAEELARRRRRGLLRGVLLGAAAWLVLVSGLVLTVQLRARELRELREELRQQQKPVEDLELLRQRVRSLSQFTDRSRGALEALRLMADATPLDGGLLVTDFTYRKDQGVTFSGTAPPGSDVVFTFLENLAASGRMRVGKIETKEQRGRAEFQAAAEWVWPDDGEGEGGGS